MTNKINVVYARFSDPSQADSSTIQVQVEECERFAGTRLVAYVDEARSGTTQAGRESFHRLLMDASQGKISTVYVLRWDRLGRNEAESFTAIQELKDYGCQVLSAHEGNDQMAMGVHLVMAAHYSRDLSIKTRNGLIQRHKQHTFTGGVAPVGFRVVTQNEKRVLAVDPEEAATVRFVFAAYTDDQQPMGLKAIANALNDRGILTRSQKAEQAGRGKINRKINRVRRPTPWCKTSIRAILTNPLYTGTCVYNRRQMKRNRKTGHRVPHFNDPSALLSYQNEALRIISDDLFNKAGGKLATRKHATTGAARTIKLIRPWTGHLFCEQCGAAFYVRKSANAKGIYFYMQCGCRQRRGPAACPNSQSPREDRLLASLQKACSAVFADIEGMVQDALAVAQAATALNRQDADRVQGQLRELNAKISILMESLADPEMDLVAKRAIGRQVGELEAKRTDLDEAVHRLLDKANDDADALGKIIRSKLEAAKDRWETLAGPAHLNGLIAEFVGPSLVSPEGLLLAVDAKKNPVPGSSPVHGGIVCT